jgi:hypothetical protein
VISVGVDDPRQAVELLELRLLVKGGSVPRRLSRHFMGPIDNEVLESV